MMLDIYYIIIYNNAWVRVDMEFFLECVTRYLTSECY